MLGPIEIADHDRAIVVSSPRQRALLALLLVHTGHTVSTDRILDELWGEEQPESGRDAVVFHVVRLRKALGMGDGSDGSPLRTRDGGYAIEVAPEAIDAVRFERLAADARARLADDPGGAVDRLTEALGLWRGEPYEGLGDAPFLAAEIRRLDELRLRASEDRLEAELALGRHAEIVTELEALVDRELLRERARGLLMTALYRSGRQADALRVYGDGRRVLAEELGIDPSPELQALEAAILRHEPALLGGSPGGGPAVRGRPRNPYKGLRPFGEADAGDFFGREALTDRLVERLAEVARDGRLLAVVGPSGSGKSSVVRAGLVPAVRAGALGGPGRWRIGLMLPGGRPFDELAAALRSASAEEGPEAAERAGAAAGGEASGRPPLPDAGRLADDPTALAAAVAALLPPDGRLLLVIDQLEELWTLASDDRVPAAFMETLVAGLADAGGRLVVVAVLRVDQLGVPLRSPSLGRLIRAGTELVPPLERAELSRAIERPAAGASVHLDPGLADTMVDEVADHPAMLPLVQYALTELVERADDRRVTRVDYQAIGGALGALAGRAEAAYHSLEPEARDVARQVFLHLVAIERTGEASARRVPLDTFDESADERSVVERFGHARLLASTRDARTGAPTVEIAHEALVARWPRLASWVDEERDAIWVRRRLSDAAEEWLERDRDTGFLLTGGRLELFAAWASTTDLHLSTDERALLAASLAERERIAAAEADRQAEERRLERRGTRWLRALVAVFAVTAVVSTTLLAQVWRQADATAEQQAVATARGLAVAANGSLETDPRLALLLAVESAMATADRGWITEETVDALHWAIQNARVAYPTQDAPVAVRFARDGARGLFLLPGADLIELARTAAGRSLTADECGTWLHEPCPPVRPPPGGELAVLTADGVMPMDRLAVPGARGTVLSVLSQLPVELSPVLRSYLAESGTSLREVPSGGVSADFLTAVGRADVAILARTGDVEALARQGLLVDLGDVLRGEEVDKVTAGPLAELGQLDGSVVGVPIAATASSILWYPAEAFRDAGYEPPTTWAELDSLVAQIIADQRGAPWCMGLLGGEADGAGGADWVEDLVIDSLRSEGFDAGPTWWPGFTDPAGMTALRRFQALVSREGAVRGGPGSAARTPQAWAAAQMGTARVGGATDPNCWLVHASAEDRTRWIGTTRRDLTPIRLPIGDPSKAAMRGRVYTLVVLRDRPEVRGLVRKLLALTFAMQLAAEDPGVGVVPLGPSGRSAWPMVSAGSISGPLAAAVGAGTFWPDASDRMSRQLGTSLFPAAALKIAEASPETAERVIGEQLRQLAQAASSPAP